MINFLNPCHWKRRFTTALLEDRWDISLKGWVKLYHLQGTPLICQIIPLKLHIGNCSWKLMIMEWVDETDRIKANQEALPG